MQTLAGSWSEDANDINADRYLPPPTETKINKTYLEHHNTSLTTILTLLTATSPLEP